MDNLLFHVITCYGSDDRQKSTKEAFESRGLNHKFFYFNKHPTNTRIGCAENHQYLYKYAYEHGMEWIAIAEDNIEVSPHEYTMEQYNTLRRFMENETWDMLILGGWILLGRRDTTTYDNIYRLPLGQVHGTSCYIIHRRYFSKFLEHPPVNMHWQLDRYLAKHTRHSYIHRPLLFYRGAKIKSIVNPFTDSVRRVWMKPHKFRIYERNFFKGENTFETPIFVLSILAIIFVIYIVLSYVFVPIISG